MKYISIVTMLFSMSLNAQVFFPLGKSGAKTKHFNKATCEAQEGKQCFDIGNDDPSYLELVEELSEDKGKPIFKEGYKFTTCASEVECLKKIKDLNLPLKKVEFEGKMMDVPDHSKHCDDDQKDFIQMKKNTLMPGWKFYCTGISSYEKVMIKKVNVNSAKKSEFNEKIAQEKIKADAKIAVSKNMAFGRDIQQEISVINASRGLSKTKIKQFVETFSTINNLLSVGAIDTARDEISKLVPDNDLLKEADKQFILNKIDQFLSK